MYKVSDRSLSHGHINLLAESESGAFGLFSGREYEANLSELLMDNQLGMKKTKLVLL